MTGSEKSAALEDLMVAMDVVDTLRHRQQLVDRELDTDGRRKRLIEKLREIYESQGLEVTDAMLEEGVLALEEDRFQYTPPKRGISYWFALIYVRRDEWLRPFLLGLGLILIAWALYYTFAVQPIKQAQAALPAALATQFDRLLSSTEDQTAISQATLLNQTGKTALANREYDKTETVIDQLTALRTQIQTRYQIRIVQRPGELSGVWRVPDVNTQARNYYLIVEAIDGSGQTMTLPIVSEETGKTSLVNRWGVRVDADIFQRVANDKRDDGIIQNRVIGSKNTGELIPEYRIPTLDGNITDW